MKIIRDPSLRQFSVSNSFWFITGTFLRQGSGLNPKGRNIYDVRTEIRVP